MDVSPKLKRATFVCIGSQTFVCIGNEPFRSYFDIGENPKGIEKEFLKYESRFDNCGVNFQKLRFGPPTGGLYRNSLRICTKTVFGQGPSLGHVENHENSRIFFRKTSII